MNQKTEAPPKICQTNFFFLHKYSEKPSWFFPSLFNSVSQPKNSLGRPWKRDIILCIEAMKNREIARIFNDIADLLEIKDDNPFKIRAYRRAAMNLEALTQDLDTLVKEDNLNQIPGIGKDLAEKIKEYYKTGKIQGYEDLKKEVPSALLEMMKIPGVGPKTVKLLYEKLNVKSVEELEKLAKAGKLKGLPGIQSKTEENIIKG
ncbi:MAG: hypothetical protein DRP73_03975, partial [Candidatus Omnitrophota bacterium]